MCVLVCYRYILILSFSFSFLKDYLRMAFIVGVCVFHSKKSGARGMLRLWPQVSRVAFKFGCNFEMSWSLFFLILTAMTPLPPSS